MNKRAKRNRVKNRVQADHLKGYHLHHIMRYDGKELYLLNATLSVTYLWLTQRGIYESQ